MKNLRHFLTLCIFSFLLIGCASEIDILDESFRSAQAELSGSGQNLRVLFDAKAGTATMELKSSQKWEASFLNGRATWCTLSAESGKRGTVTITVSVDENTTYDERSASIAFKCNDVTQTLVVVQKQKDAVLLSSEKLEVPKEGGTVNLTVQHNVDFSVSVDPSAASWMEVLSTKALASGTVTLRIDANEDVSSRSGRVFIQSKAGQEVATVYQDGATPALVLTQSSYSLSDEGGEIVVEIKSNVNFEYAVSEGADWIREVETKAMSTHTLYFAVSVNDTYDERTGKIRFTDKEHGLEEEVSILQKQKDALLLTCNKYEVSDEGDVITVEIKSNVAFEYTIPEGEDWIAEVKTKGLTTHTLQFEIKANGTADERTGKIVFSDKHSGLSEAVTVIQRQKNVLLLTEREYKVPVEGATITVEVKSNIEFGYEITEGSEWIAEVKTKGLTTYTLQFAISANPLSVERRGAIVFSDKNTGIEQTVIIIQDENGTEKAILLEILDACTDNVWKNRYQNFHHWKEDRPLNEWGMIGLNEAGKVDSLNLYGFKGILPEAICDLSDLRVLALRNGSLPSFPDALLRCISLEDLDLAYNKMSGEIPEKIGDLKNLFFLSLTGNSGLTGKIPESLRALSCWKCFPLEILYDTGLESSASDFIAPEFDWTDIDGNRLSSDELYKNNDYTVLYGNSASYYNTKLMQDFAITCKEYPGDVAVVLCFEEDDSPAEIDAFRKEHAFSWPCVAITNDVLISGRTGYRNYYSNYKGTPTSADTHIIVVDRNGNVVYFSGFFCKGENALLVHDFLMMDYYRRFGYYASTDYSHEGEVVQLQKASEGKGIDLVFMGDGYSDRLIADGTYDTDMKRALEGFFLFEPYKSFRHLFNAYYIVAISKNDLYDKEYGTETAFGIDVSGTIKCNDKDKVRNYALQALGNDSNRYNHSTITTVVRSYSKGGSLNFVGDPLKGLHSLSFCSFASMGMLERTVCHESAGHGFARLGDEYSGSGNLNYFKEKIDDLHNEWCYMNVDITDDPETIIWSKFLKRPEYAGSVGIFEGSGSISKGAYRPSENSVMRISISGNGFNAPSREAIYYRIHKMAYGDAWTYDFDNFLKYDKINLNTASH